MPLSFRLKTYLNNKIKSEYIYDTEGDTISLKSYEYDIISPRFVINEEYFLAHPYNHSMKNPMNPAVRQIRRSEYFHLSNGIYDYKKEYVNGLLTKIILYRYTYHPVNGKDLLKTTQ